MDEKEWYENFDSLVPKVKLIRVDYPPNADFNLAIAAARSCYSSKLVDPDEIEEKIELARNISSGTWQAGHHTVYQHTNFNFGISGVSRQALWSFFHTHPFYNSEQVSQRYVPMSKAGVIIPNLEDKAREVYEECIEFQMSMYEKFRNETLLPAAKEAYFERFPSREKLTDQKKIKKYDSEIHKKTQEVARYFSPIAMHANLYHSINFITLARYQSALNSSDVPTEIRYIVKKMVDLVLERNPEYKDLGLIKPSIEKERFIEHKSKSYLGSNRENELAQWRAEFDNVLGFDRTLGEDRRSRLVDYKPHAVQEMANSVRDILGLPRSSLSDKEAIRIVIDPSYNTLRGMTLTLDHTTKLSRAGNIPHFTFAVKLSHTADSQAQRQRMSPATRPILENVVGRQPDYIIPSLVKASGDQAVVEYCEGMQRIWGYRNKLIDMNVSPEMANYILPNAVAIRYRENVDLLNFAQKDTKRECLNAQEEIGRITLQQRQDVESVHPELKGMFGPPCYLRHDSGDKPYCPEKDRYCGVPVWRAKDGEERYSIEKVMAERVI